MRLNKRRIRKSLLVGLGISLLLGLIGIQSVAQKVTLRVGYATQPSIERQIYWMQEWARENPDVEIQPVPMGYEGYPQKVLSNFLSQKGEFDLVWHNDDWSQIWFRYLEALNDVKNAENQSPMLRDAFVDKEGRITAVAFSNDPGAMFYNKKVIPKPPSTWEELVVLCKAAQESGEVKWGMVAGMVWPHTVFGIHYVFQSNNADVFYPAGERNLDVLASYGWTPMVNHPNHVESIEWVWDIINKYKISPPDMSTYTRTAADAVFMAGNAAISYHSVLMWRDYNDPEKSKVAGDIGLAPYPAGPQGTRVSATGPWSWAVPKNIPAENKKAAKKLIEWLLNEEKVAIDMFESVGTFPVTAEMEQKLAEKNPQFAYFYENLLQAPGMKFITSPIYYIPEWSQIYKTHADYCTGALTGPRENIKSEMEKLAKEITRIMNEAGYKSFVTEW